jgi:hypothetical protein
MKRHRLDLLSLVAGLLFAGLGTAFLLDALDQWSADLTWVPPIVLIVLGLGGVASTIDRHAPRTATVEAPDNDDDGDTPPPGLATHPPEREGELPNR